MRKIKQYKRIINIILYLKFQFPRINLINFQNKEKFFMNNLYIHYKYLVIIQIKKIKNVY